MTLISPDGGEAWAVGTARSITWSIVGSITHVNLKYSTDAGLTYPYTIVSSVRARELSYLWTVPDTISRTVRVKISDVADAAVYDTSNGNFKIRGDVMLLSPQGGEVWEVENTESIRWRIMGTIGSVALKYSLDGGLTYPYTIVDSVEAREQRFSWSGLNK